MLFKVHVYSFEDVINAHELMGGNGIIMIDQSFDQSSWADTYKQILSCPELKNINWGICDSAWGVGEQLPAAESIDDFVPVLVDMGMKFYQPAARISEISEKHPRLMKLFEQNKTKLIGRKILVDEDDWYDLVRDELSEEAEFVWAHDIYIYQGFDEFCRASHSTEEEGLSFSDLVSFSKDFSVFLGGELDMSAIKRLKQFETRFKGLTFHGEGHGRYDASGLFRLPKGLDLSTIDRCIRHFLS